MDDGYTWYHVRAMHRYKNTEGWIRGDFLVLPDTLFCDLIDIAIGEKHVISLKSDGSIIAGGTNHCDPCNVVGLYDAVNVDAGWYTSFVFFADQTCWAQGRALGYNVISLAKDYAPLWSMGIGRGGAHKSTVGANRVGMRRDFSNDVPKEPGQARAFEKNQMQQCINDKSKGHLAIERMLVFGVFLTPVSQPPCRACW